MVLMITTLSVYANQEPVTRQNMILNVDFFDTEGNASQEFANNDILFASVNIKSLLSKDALIVVYMSVLYEDALTKAVSYSIPVKPMETITDFRLELDLSDATMFNKVELMAWDAKSLTPLIQKQQLVYSNQEIQMFEMTNAKSNVLRYYTNKRIRAIDLDISNFIVKKQEEKLSISEIRYEPLNNEIRFYLQEEISLDEIVDIKSAELNCLDGEKILINTTTYPCWIGQNDLYSSGFYSMKVCDSEGNAVLKTKKSGEYTVNIEFINNNQIQEKRHISLYSKSGLGVKKLDELEIEIEKISKYTYKNIFVLEKDSTICLIIEK